MDPLPPLCNIYYAKAGALCYNETNTVFQSVYGDQQHRSVKYLFGISSILKRFLGDNNDKEIARYRGIVEQINVLEPSMVNLTDDKLTGYTQKFRERLAQGETMEEILPEAFAVVRETSRRVLGMRHFDVQLIGGICLHEGRIAEMRTGEGKTLVATTAVYLNALAGKGVHMVTVNDYLARRDSEWMGKLYRYLGLSVGLIAHNMDFPERKAAYASDVTFGTNNEFGFDYLRDNMVLSESQMVQRDLHYAIVDEVDSILIDEARTPLIISGPGTKSTDNYRIMADAVRHLKEGEDYTVDEKAKTVAPMDSAVPKIEKIVGISNLYAPENIELSHCFTAALRAKALMHRDRDYVVKGDEIIIVDEFTGRLMEGRRYSDGLHQAIEAKEGVKIQRESQTLASITFQNYFRMYDKLAGMTGTAKTEENEFLKIYKLPVIVIPTNKPVRRVDEPDVIYKTKAGKYRAVGQAVKEIHETGQPVLIGTTSIVQSEEMSHVLKKNGIPHVVLNAKFHEKEAEIVANAGQKGAVTIATNMAGRGTDIKLGEGVEALGGLYIVGTERHESRRIDNQLRGRRRGHRHRHVQQRLRAAHHHPGRDDHLDPVGFAELPAVPVLAGALVRPRPRAEPGPPAAGRGAVRTRADHRARTGEEHRRADHRHAGLDPPVGDRPVHPPGPARRSGADDVPVREPGAVLDESQLGGARLARHSGSDLHTEEGVAERRPLPAGGGIGHAQPRRWP